MESELTGIWDYQGLNLPAYLRSMIVFRYSYIYHNIGNEVIRNKRQILRKIKINERKILTKICA